MSNENKGFGENYDFVIFFMKNYYFSKKFNFNFKNVTVDYKIENNCSPSDIEKIISLINKEMTLCTYVYLFVCCIIFIIFYHFIIMCYNFAAT